MLIVSLSGRALAQSARRGGWQPMVLDGFSDIDTLQASSQCVRLSIRDGRLEANELLTGIHALGLGKDRLPMVYGTGLESNPALLERLFEEHTVYGNSPETVRLVNDPRTFFKLLDELMILHPEVRFIPPGDDKGWLMKRRGSSGGGHVRLWSIDSVSSCEHYFQSRVPGPAMSVLFLSCHGVSRIIGFNTQWVHAADGDSPFHCAGAINRAALSANQIKKVKSYVTRLSEALALRGLNSLDFILFEGEPAVLELNPRPGATFELYEQDVPEGLLYWHIQACKGRMPSMQKSIARPVRAHAIVYAPQLLRSASDMHWPVWSADRPAGGSRVNAGEPLCSVSAEGTDRHEVKSLVHLRKCTVLQALYNSRQAA